MIAVILIDEFRPFFRTYVPQQASYHAPTTHWFPRSVFRGGHNEGMRLGSGREVRHSWLFPAIQLRVGAIIPAWV